MSAQPRYTIAIQDAENRILAFVDPATGEPTVAPRSFAVEGILDRNEKARRIMKAAHDHTAWPARGDLCRLIPAVDAMFMVPGTQLAAPEGT